MVEMQQEMQELRCLFKELANQQTPEEKLRNTKFKWILSLLFESEHGCDTAKSVL